MSTPRAAYDSLHRLFRENALLRSAEGLLAWDQETGMPAKASEWRADQMALLSGMLHRRATAPEIGEWIDACLAAGFPENSAEAVNTRGWKRDYDRAVKLPAELVEEFAGVTSRASECGRRRAPRRTSACSCRYWRRSWNCASGKRTPGAGTPAGMTR